MMIAVCFEKLCLEKPFTQGNWAGEPILDYSGETFRSAFQHFDFNKVALFSDKDLKRFLDNKGIVR